MLRDYWLPIVMGIFAMSFIPLAAAADWQLNNSKSSIHFISIKKSTVGEIHTFQSINGSISQSGKAQITIPLSSVETNIPIRNDRMKSMLFEIPKYTEASISTMIDSNKITGLKPGDSLVSKTKIDISLHGAVVSTEANLQTIMLSNGQLAVSTVKPLIINAEDFSLVSGIQKLKAIANLPSISTVVPITVNLIFDKQ